MSHSPSRLSPGNAATAPPRNAPYDYSNRGWPRDFDIRTSAQDPAEHCFPPPAPADGDTGRRHGG